MATLINVSILGDSIRDIVRGLSQENTRERWFGISADQSGNDWAADRLTPYVATSGNGVYGTEIKVIGTADTPIFSNSTHFILHRLLIVGVDHADEYKVRIAYAGTDFASAIAANQYTEAMFKFDPATPPQSPGLPVCTDIPQVIAGTKVWVDVKNTNNGSTASFYVGLREFENS